MKGRDLLILAAVVLLGGFAVADALRSEDGAGRERRTEAATTEPGQVEVTVSEPDGDLGRARFPAVNGAGGALVITQTGSCAVREFDLPTGLEFRNVVARSTCQLWAAPVTAKVAVGIAEPQGDAVPFRFVDLARPGRNLGTSEAAFGALLWSEDGQRAAWCNRRRVGVDLELGAGRRRLAECPAAFTPDGEIVYARGDRLFVEGRPGLRASGGITAVRFGRDGSLAVVVEGRRLERYVEGELTDALDLRGELEGRLPVLSPDNCAALFRTGDETVSLVTLGCSPLAWQSYRGTSGAWAPNGEWIVVAGPDELVFHRPDRGAEPVRWPVGAAAVAWRRG